MSVADIGPAGRVVADNIKKLRKAAGLSLRELEALLREAGRPIQMTGLHRLETYKRRVDIDELAAIAQVLGVTAELLLQPGAAGDVLTAVQAASNLHVVAAAERAIAAAVRCGLPRAGLFEYISFRLDSPDPRPNAHSG